MDHLKRIWPRGEDEWVIMKCNVISSGHAEIYHLEIPKVLLLISAGSSSASSSLNLAVPLIIA